MTLMLQAVNEATTKILESGEQAVNAATEAAGNTAPIVNAIGNPLTYWLWAIGVMLALIMLVNMTAAPYAPRRLRRGTDVSPVRKIMHSLSDLIASFLR